MPKPGTGAPVVHHEGDRSMTFPLSRFTATPAEIHAFLTEHLAEDTYLAYQQRIGAAAVREAADEVRDLAAQVPPFGEHDEARAMNGAAEAVDPDHDGGPWPSVLVRHFGPRLAAREEDTPVKGGALRAHGRCDAYARRGTGYGVCDQPMDSLGRCSRPGGHVTDDVQGGGTR
ncbi:hypothetical protein ACFV42_46485 [Streptomyces solisilvae]|uniref:hypothetical protein n=1 Tax=Streptomyces malaysiensis TaxID=92644 RepID=UPI00369F70B7